MAESKCVNSIVVYAPGDPIRNTFYTIHLNILLLFSCLQWRKQDLDVFFLLILSPLIFSLSSSSSSSLSSLSPPFKTFPLLLLTCLRASHLYFGGNMNPLSAPFILKSVFQLPCAQPLGQASPLLFKFMTMMNHILSTEASIHKLSGMATISLCECWWHDVCCNCIKSVRVRC